MNQKHRIITTLSIFLLTWCGTPTPTIEEKTQKQPFFISTVAYSSLKKEYELKKTGKLASSSEITVTAQIWWRVSSLNKGIGDGANKWDNVIQLQETSGVYSFWAQKASAAITQAKINYEQTMLNLEKAIQDTEFNIKQATNQAENASLNSQVSAAWLQLQSARESFEKAKLDYQTKLTSDEQTISNFSQTANNLVNDVKLLYESTITESDKILWITNVRKASNDSFEHLLGAKNTATKFAAEDALRQVLIHQQSLQTFTITTQGSQLSASLSELTTYLRNLQPVVNQIDTMLQFTITWPVYSEAQLAIHQWTIDWLQAQIQWQISAITAQINTIQTFLRTYKDNQASLAKAVDLSEQAYKTAEANLQTAQNNTTVQVTSLENTLSTTEKNKTTTEKALRNSIAQAQIAYNEAWFQLSKLSATAPIAGTITDILVDVGQDVSPGTPLYTMSSIWDKEIEITLTQEEATSLQTDTPVRIRFWTKEANGVLSQISQTPTAGVSYKAVVITESNEIPAGSLVDIVLPQATTNVVVPLNRVQLLSTTEWQIVVRDGNSLETKTVELGQLKWSQIEIVTTLSPSEAIVTSDTKQYDPEKYTITVKQ